MKFDVSYSGILCRLRKKCQHHRQEYNLENTSEFDLENNLLLREFLLAGDLSEAGLKKVYRRLCFSVHPDISENEQYNFIQLKKDYQSILESFDFIASKLKNIRDKNLHYTFSDLRKDLYLAIREYIGLGLHSPRVRIRQELKARNDKIINRLISLGKRYDPAFIEAFVPFNNITFHSFESQRLERMHKKLKEKLLTGISNAADYIVYGRMDSLKRVALSYFNDIKYLPIPENDFGKAIWKLSEWFYRDLTENG